jgi:hypothetical protein
MIVVRLLPGGLERQYNSDHNDEYEERSMEHIKKPLLISALWFSALLFASVASYAQTETQAEKNGYVQAQEENGKAARIVGDYQCKGYDPYGKNSYGNPVRVTKNGETYSFQWLTSKGYPFILGTGVLHPDLSDVISVVFWDPKKADYFGTEIFSIKPDGSLSATWTLQGENLVGTENCVKK